MIEITDKAHKFVQTFEPGLSLWEIYKQFSIGSKEEPPVLAMYNNELADLHMKAEVDGEVEWFSLRSKEGNLCYQRTLIFLMVRAVAELYPEGRLQVKHSLGKALYCELHLGKVLVAEDVESIEYRMHELADRQEPIKKISVTREHIVDICKANTADIEARLLERLQNEKIMLYECGPVIDYYFGPTLPHMGYMKYFMLKHYAPGFLLLYPTPESPYTIPPYEELPKFARVFLEAEEWGKILRCQYAVELNDYIEQGEIQSIVDMAESLQEKKLGQIADTVVCQHPKIKVILIAGPTSAGKTTICKRLITQLRINNVQPVMISLDNYFHEWQDTPRDKAGNYDFESFDAMDVKLLNEQLIALNQGTPVYLPRFNFNDGSRYFDTVPTQLSEGQPIVLEGLHALNDRLTYTLPRYEKFKIYLGVLTQIRLNDRNRVSTTDIRLLRRMVRDSQFRNRTAEETLQMWDSVREGEELNIFPFQEDADVVFNTSMAYEVAVLKGYVEPLLHKIGKENSHYHEVCRLLGVLQGFQVLASEVVPHNSLLREFIGNN